MTEKLAQQDKDNAKGDEIPLVVIEAQRRFKYCRGWFDLSYQRFNADYKFANGDSDNHFQWPDDVYSDRSGQGPDSPDHPCLTINKVRQHNFQIVNDAKRNKPGIKFSPIGNEATAQSANVYNCLARKIEQQSNATAIYDEATKYMVGGGFGWWRIKPDYRDSTSFNQEIFIRPIQNPLTVWLDPNTIQPDKIDAKYGFVMEEISRELFEAKYPKFKDYINIQPFDGCDGSWMTESTVRVAEYYRIVGVPDTLWAYIPNGANEPQYIKQSMLKGDLLEQVKNAPSSRSRPIMDEKLEWYFIVGHQIADKRLEMPGKYIPIVKITGEETVIDGQYDCKSHTRALKDPQRMFNYWASSAVEYGALQTKTPWLAAKESIEGNVNDWNTANVNNKAVLQYNALADDGITPLPPPERIQPPVSAPVALDGMRLADEQMMSVSGQFQAMMGAPSNERSGKAINERQRQGETATYHYIDAVAIGIRKTGKLVLDLIPHIYDAPQIIQALGEDGKTIQVQIDPSLEKHYMEQQAQDGQSIQRALNPTLGAYDVVADVGPSFSTKREEAFNAFMQLMGQAPTLVPILGDILLRNADFPMSEEAADRLRRGVPSHLLGDGPSVEEQAMQQQIQNFQQMIGELMQDNAELKIKLKGKDQQKVIDLMNAITARLKLILPKPESGEVPESDLRALVQDTMKDVFGTPVEQVGDASEPTLEATAAVGAAQHPNLNKAQPPIPGARMGSDGQWYARDYSSGGMKWKLL